MESLNIFSEITLFDNTALLDSLKLEGLHKVRCSLTGQVIAEMTDSTLEKAIDYLRFENPLITDSQIVDKMQIRWLVASSRPAMHLTSVMSHDAHTFLVENQPRDIFAMLMGRMLFEYEKTDNGMFSSESQKEKLFWLIQLQDNEEFQSFGPTFAKALDGLIRLDSIHSIRKVFYTSKMREIALAIRDSDITEKMLLAFITEVENEGFKELAKRKTPPTGNTQSLNAMLKQAGVLPFQVRMKQKEEESRKSSVEFASRILASRVNDSLERIKAGVIDESQTVVLENLEGQLHSVLKQKFEAAAKRKERQDEIAMNRKTNDTKPKATKAKGGLSKSILKSQQRFGDLDFSF
jgi:hypothetical protein